ncbi:hypothetical protein [Catenuloplanes indicus]|uniref:Helix-turn-helix domain-containing protein n=1 Tax=Catenuloplanes indicus TaxID=137267 RepID=A0AAE3W962_9ACTN|nr:hypothetical protein [Catenuloplanes indicus]MDQ0371577.1 hypothetical protein [Catenuloplanes indicus]
MGVKLMVEILDHAPAAWTQSERLLAVSIAEQVRDSVRRGAPTIDLLALRTGMNAESISKTLRRLSDKGYEFRVPQGKDRTGRVVFAYRGMRTEFVVPKLCPLAVHATNICVQFARDEPADVATESVERPDGGPAITGDLDAPRPLVVAERPDQGPVKGQESPDGGPAIRKERADHRPAIKAERPDGGPEWPDGGPALPLNPLKDLPSGAAPVASPTAASAPAEIKTGSAKSDGTQGGLFDRATAGHLTEAQKTIHNSLINSGYPDVTLDDVRGTHRQVLASCRDKNRASAYITRIANGPNGFQRFYDAHRAVQAELAAADVERALDTAPPCEHGTPAGRTVSPVHGGYRCFACRKGQPAAERRPDATNDVVAAAVDAYRRAYPGALRRDIGLRITGLGREVLALLHGGAAPDQVVALAAAAGAAQTPLLEYAASGRNNAA